MDAEPDGQHAHHGADHLGERALAFGEWFLKSKFELMDHFLGELKEAPEERDAADIERRFRAATRHARRVQLARMVVTVLLAFGAIATAGTSLLERFGTVRTIGALQTAAALSGSLTLVFLAARLAFDRYLDLIETSATFLAMQLPACARVSGRAGPSAR